MLIWNRGVTKGGLDRLALTLAKAGAPRLRDGRIDIGCYQAVPLPGFMLMLK